MKSDDNELLDEMNFKKGPELKINLSHCPFWFPVKHVNFDVIFYVN